MVALFALVLILLVGAVAYSRGWFGPSKEIHNNETIIEKVVPTPAPSPAPQNQ